MIWLWGTAFAGDLDAEVALDSLAATSTSDEALVGDVATKSADLGISLRGELRQGRILAAVDYDDREWLLTPDPGPGDVFEPSRLLYRAEIAADLVPDKLEIGVGRFLSPSIVFTPVDGARVHATPNELLSIDVFGGRRGVSTSRENIGFDEFLPAFGGEIAFGGPKGRIDVRAQEAGDETTLGRYAHPTHQDYNAFTGTIDAWLRPDESLTAGLSGTLAQRATYLLSGPGAPEVDVTAADLYQALAWASMDATKDLRFDADLLRQAALLSPLKPKVDPPGPDEVLLDPTFTDARLRARIRAFDAAWIAPDLRLRLRDTRTELRVGGSADVDKLPISGLFLHGELYWDDILMDHTLDDVGLVDRLLWEASTGYRKGAVDAEVGASFTDRGLAPVSARGQGDATSVDLSPFVLQAQNVVFARGFWTDKRFFGGLDLETSVFDRELRAYLQIGFLADASWGKEESKNTPTTKVPGSSPAEPKP